MIFVLQEGDWYWQSQTINTTNTYKYLRLHSSAVTYQLFRTSCYLFAHSHGTIKIRTFPEIYLNIMKYVAENLIWSDDREQLLVLGWVLKNNERSPIICYKFRYNHRSHTSCNVAISTSTTAGNRKSKELSKFVLMLHEINDVTYRVQRSRIRY